MKKKTVKRVLRLLNERPIATLLNKNDARGRLEASGVAVMDNAFYTVFDNTPHIARLKNDLSLNPNGTVWHQGEGEGGEGYEALTWSPEEKRFYAVIEAVKIKKKTYRAHILTFDANLKFLTRGEVAFDFKHENKGLEGLAALSINGKPILLGLCEAPIGKKKKKKKGRTGLVLILEPKGPNWSVLQKLTLPREADFEDFSDIAIDQEGRVAVLSQEDGALWVGQLNTKSWTFAPQSEVFTFPTNQKNKPVYCNVEGVSWIDPQHVVIVSDRSKDDQPSRCRNKEQSIHLFALPNATQNV